MSTPALGVVSAASTGSAATRTPGPSPQTPQDVGPGLWGFVVVFALAVVVWLLMRNMTGHLRRLRFREQERLRREAGERGTRGEQDGRPPEPRR